MIQLSNTGSDEETFAYPRARPPERIRRVDSFGVSISVLEWGNPGAPPLLLAHGGFDFARTYDVFAPLLADAGWRVVAWDQRGHGDSEHAAMYSWEADLRDAASVLDATTTDPVPVVGHSKGGAMMLRLANTWPHRVSRLVNLDGVPSGRRMPDLADHERTRLLADELTGWLDHRQKVQGRQRRPGTAAELAERRHAMNPRLPLEWLQYLVGAGARRDRDGWRWKIDPQLRFGGFGPWRPEWSLQSVASVSTPILAILAGQEEILGWHTRLEDVEPYAPPGTRFEVLEDSGHFIHIEQPDRVAGLVLEFLA